MSLINTKQIRGGGGGGGSGPTLTASFSYLTASPLVLQAVTSGQKVYRATLTVNQAFTDPATTLQVGTTTVPDLCFTAGDIDPLVISQYDSEAVSLILVSDILILTISAGSSTTGTGTIYLWLTS